MATRKAAGSSKKAATSNRQAAAAVTKRGGTIRSTEGVRVWSEIGVTLPVADFTSLKFHFGHERIAKNDTQEELARVVNLVDEFNEAELERRIRKYQRLVRRVSADDEDDWDEEPKTRRRRRNSGYR